MTINQHNGVSDADACGDFGVVWDINLTAVITTYFDKEGRRIRQIAEITEDNTVMNTVSGLTLRDGPVAFRQDTSFDPETGLRELIYITGTSVNVVRDKERLIDRGPILIDGQTGEILAQGGTHPARELLDGSIDISLALPAFCDILS